MGHLAAAAKEELRNRNRELGQLNINVERARACADAIVQSMREPLLVLDGDLKIVRENRAFYANFKPRREDTEGRLLYEQQKRKHAVRGIAGHGVARRR